MFDENMKKQKSGTDVTVKQPATSDIKQDAEHEEVKNESESSDKPLEITQKHDSDVIDYKQMQ